MQMREGEKRGGFLANKKRGMTRYIVQIIFFLPACMQLQQQNNFFS